MHTAQYLDGLAGRSVFALSKTDPGVARYLGGQASLSYYMGGGMECMQRCIWQVRLMRWPSRKLHPQFRVYDFWLTTPNLHLTSSTYLGL